MDEPLIMPEVQGCDDGAGEWQWRVASDWRARVTIGCRDYWLYVLEGFVTDGASVPRMVWAAAGHPMELPRLYAALAHDWLYAAHVCTRQEADDVYRQLLLRVGRSAWRVAVEYAMLRAFGASAWRGHGPDDETFARGHGGLVLID